MRALRFASLTADLLPEIEPWFDDPETIRFLGDPWIRRELRLVEETPGTEYWRRRVVGRDAWVIFDEGPVGVIDVERYDDGRAGCVVVVAPARRCQGVGRAILDAVFDRSELADVEELIAGVDPQNMPKAGAALRSQAFGWRQSPMRKGC